MRWPQRTALSPYGREAGREGQSLALSVINDSTYLRDRALVEMNEIMDTQPSVQSLAQFK